MKRVLMVAFHFPPFAGSSGVQRTLRFVQHLPKFGWQPIVLSANPIAYEASSNDLLAEIPPGTPVCRAFALNSARHLAIGGRYLAATARPDRWITWKFDAIRQGMRLIREHRPQAIWSTYPIATAHLIGAELARRSGLPLIADFRDPMAQDGYPADPITWRKFREIEELAIRRASFSTFTTPGAMRSYRLRYPDAATRIGLLENGYDEESFVAAEAVPACHGPLNPGRITLLHSGVVYPEERDPTSLCLALQALKNDPALPAFVIRFRASGHDALLRQLAERHAIGHLLQIVPPVGYSAALHEMLRADALLVMQAANCNEQIPAKLYEYLRARRPVVALTDPAGDTAQFLVRAGQDWMAPLDEPQAIVSRLRQVLPAIAAGQYPAADRAIIEQASRRSRTGELAGILDSVTSATTRS